jgi:hypothetical protein
LVISPRCRLIVLDGLAFDGFNTAVAAPANILQLNNVKFNNCKIAVQSDMAFPAKKSVSGKFTNPALKLDSLPLTVSPKK